MVLKEWSELGLEVWGQGKGSARWLVQVGSGGLSRGFLSWFGFPQGAQRCTSSSVFGC